jgi:phosphatidylinositol alpha-1,6-mannosyltransferase
MNFLIVTFDFPPTVGGIETRVKNYIQNLLRMNQKVRVVALTQRKDPVYVENYNGATVYRCRSSPKGIFKVFFIIKQAVKDYPIDALLILTGANSLIGLLFLLYGKAKRTKTGIFLYGKDILMSKNNPLQFLLLLLALFLADKIGVNSKATSHLLPKRIRHKINLLYPGVNTQSLKRYEISQAPSKKEKLILFVGRLIKRKGLDDLLRAFKLVLKKIPNAKLIIVGDGPERAMLSNLTETLGIQGKVEFTGVLTGRKLYEKYRACDVFVMPSKKIDRDVEGFGIVFLEVGLFKKPSIGTWSGGIPEAVVHKQTGILVSEGEIIALANAIELLLTDENLARKLGENAYNKVIKNFTWEKATLRLLQMFQR